MSNFYYIGLLISCGIVLHLLIRSIINELHVKTRDVIQKLIDDVDDLKKEVKKLNKDK